VANSITSVKVIPILADSMAMLKVNGVTATSGVQSASILLNADTTTIAITVTAPDGVTKNDYVILITRAAPAPAVMAYQQQEMPTTGDQVLVHQNVSPNGDGKGDGMVIEGITAYPDNKLQIMNVNGNLIYEAKGYDNTTKVFDGHANNGKLQQVGTYFYSLEYKVGKDIKRKSGFIVLKY
jgi:gliding motility-associated-like protein